ncbi:hypothetical protein GCM10011396_30070 [Undibacterium terreum]|uniref:Uncharacterized protein n=1 Tax=Undibacterium terreum TaxID=1224302 RepID=A0A916XLR0_9BURK|nr:hypothetical protein GCM10011396_30070 [Undibacterium terreum]
MQGVNSELLTTSATQSSATFKTNPPGTAHLGALQRCAASKDGQSLRRDAPRTASQMDSFALAPIDEMSSIKNGVKKPVAFSKTQQAILAAGAILTGDALP